MAAERLHPLQGRISALVLLVGILAAFFGAYQLLEQSFLEPHLDPGTLNLLHIIRWIAAAVIVAAVVAVHVFRTGRADRAEAAAASPATLLDRDARQRRNLVWFVQMRWIAAAVSLALIAISVPLTHILPRGALTPLLAWWAVLVTANAFFSRWSRSGRAPDRQVLAQVMVDLLVLTGLLNASGGIENPLYITFLFHVIIAGIILPKPKVVAVTVAAALCFSFLAIGEYLGILPHSSIDLFRHEHLVDAPPVGDGLEHAAFNIVFVMGRLVPFVGVLFLTAYFTTLVIDRLRQSESELERAAARALLEGRRLESVIDAAGLGLVVIDAELDVKWVNQRAGSWLAPLPLAVGRPLGHTHDDAGCLACLTSAVVMSGVGTETERRGGSEGPNRHFRHASSPVRDEEGHVVQVVHLVEDITERKTLEAEALHAGKLSVLGQMAAGIAHEIGNPLSSLEARLHRMRRDPSPPFLEESLGVLQSQLDRIGRIVRGVSHFARARTDAWTAWDLNKVVGEAVSLVRLDRRALQIDFRESFAPALPPIRGVRDQIEQVLVNLLLNAVEAMPAGGSIRIDTAARDHQVAVSIRDTGAGMDPAVQAKLFQPFFTTKPSGTGLGLSICYSLVHA
ncbi:MAG TPA: ATP-binding protein, partial [Thermoanaerobaculia bacterium]|nr:ATP-binding protein [Thermoanaerobaculia bacterium]